MTRAPLALALLLCAVQNAAPEPAPKGVTVVMALLNAAIEYHLDAVLVFQVAVNESSLRANCQTWRDGVLTARGLMQPSVRYQNYLVATYLGWPPASFDWANPVHSAKLGCAYLAALVARFGTWGGVAAYNCGPGRMNEWPRHRSLPAETWVYCHRIFGGAS